MKTHNWDDWRDPIASNAPGWLMVKPVAPEPELTPEEWRTAAEARLADLGLTYEELECQAHNNRFDSTAARKLWVLIGGTL